MAHLSQNLQAIEIHPTFCTTEAYNEWYRFHDKALPNDERNAKYYWVHAGSHRNELREKQERRCREQNPRSLSHMKDIGLLDGECLSRDYPHRLFRSIYDLAKFA